MITYKAKTWMNSRQVVSAVKQASVQLIMKAGFLVEREAKLSMVKGGRTTGPGGGMVGTPSAPGDPPHVQTGNLRSSIQTAMTRWLTVVVGPTLMAWYGRIHEFGSKNRAKRPFMRPALERTRRRFAALFKGLKLSRTPAGMLLNRAKGRL